MVQYSTNKDPTFVVGPGGFCAVVTMLSCRRDISVGSSVVCAMIYITIYVLLDNRKMLQHSTTNKDPTFDDGPTGFCAPLTMASC